MTFTACPSLLSRAVDVLGDVLLSLVRTRPNVTVRTVTNGSRNARQARESFQLLHRLFQAAQDNKVHLLEHLLETEEGAAGLVNASFECASLLTSGRTMIHAASLKGNLECIDLLIRHGADVNAADDNGYTPLFVAAQYGQTATVVKLLENGALANVPSRSGLYPIHIAANNGRTGCVRVLCELGNSEVDPVDKVGWTPVQYAIHRSTIETIEYLLSMGAQPKPYST